MRKGITAGIWSLLSMLFLLQITSAAERPNGGVSYDIVIMNGKVVDGSGNPWFYADLAIKGGKIVKIGKVDPKSGKRVIDAKGMTVSPGFIDLHTHTDMPALADGNVESKVRQGVTFDVIGESSTVAPLKGAVLDEYKEEAKRRGGVDVDWTTLDGYFRRLNKKGVVDEYRFKRIAAADPQGRRRLRRPSGNGRRDRKNETTRRPRDGRGRGESVDGVHRRRL